MNDEEKLRAEIADLKVRLSGKTHYCINCEESGRKVLELRRALDKAIDLLRVNCPGMRENNPTWEPEGGCQKVCDDRTEKQCWEEYLMEEK